MTGCFFVSDLHGKVERYRKLFDAIAAEEPRAVFIGGDILPNFGYVDTQDDFLEDFLFAELVRLRIDLGETYPSVFIILGNDDGRAVEKSLIEASADGLLSYMHGRKGLFERWTVYGYSHSPPSPFLLKDWERYDVSRFVDPGCVSPEEGMRTVPISPDEARFETIARDLETLAGSDDLENAVFLFHAPPHKSNLDRAGLDGRHVDHAPLDVHVGSIAIRRFIETRQPLLTLHGHVHESARITGSWRERFGRTVALSAAHDGPELALVRFDLEDPASAARELL
ncbi:MAG: metallophosphoesterase [Candidatus Krumholzibacteria bacterium]|nr:metallophosphoesterase [Candidatus Krumholzibacteria bacterium]